MNSTRLPLVFTTLDTLEEAIRGDISIKPRARKRLLALLTLQRIYLGGHTDEAAETPRTASVVARAREEHAARFHLARVRWQENGEYADAVIDAQTGRASAAPRNQRELLSHLRTASCARYSYRGLPWMEREQYDLVGSAAA